MNITALIPARANSKRIPGKNIKHFFGHPLLAYTIRRAIDSGVYNRIIVSTESDEIAQVAKQYGAEIFVRPEEFAQDDSSDIDWIKDALGMFNVKPDILCILRPTNPFRSKRMLIMSMLEFIQGLGFDSMRAIEPVKQHPYKMWSKLNLDNEILPLILGALDEEKEFTKPTQSLPEYYVQNGSLEIIWTKTIEKFDNVCGETIMPYFTEGYEGFDLNTQEDWILAEELVKRGLVKLPDMGEK